MPQINWQATGAALWRFFDRHSDIVYLYIYYLAITMRPTLPTPFSKIAWMEWCWEWHREALISFFERMKRNDPGPGKTVTVDATIVKTTEQHTVTPPDEPPKT